MGVIRIILALSVVVWHAPGQHLKLLNAAVAVLLFFIISGFYMALVVNEIYASSGERWIRRFYTARFLRLYPAYGAMCLVMIAWYWWTRNPNAFTSRLPLPAGEQALIAAINISVIGQDLYELMNHIQPTSVRSLFGASFFNPGFMLVGQAWSLSSELFFYALVPLVVRRPVRLLVLLFASLAVRAALIGGLGLESGIWGYWFIPATMCMFTLGSLSYSLYREIKQWRWAVPIGWCLLLAMVAWLGWLTVLYQIVLPVDATDNIDRPRFWIAYLAFAAAVPFVFTATKSLAIDRAIGDLSYPLYLAHGLTVGLVYFRWQFPRDALGTFALAVAASLFGGFLLRAVELAIDWFCLNARTDHREARTAKPGLIKPVLSSVSRREQLTRSDMRLTSSEQECS
jgi:peptidoglycan/LPS O-acetylase OafA/YrhL